MVTAVQDETETIGGVAPPYDYRARFDAFQAGNVSAEEIVSELKSGPAERTLVCARPSCAKAFTRQRSYIWHYITRRHVPHVFCNKSCLSSREGRLVNSGSKFAIQVREQRRTQKTAAEAVREAETILRDVGFAPLADRLRRDVLETVCN